MVALMMISGQALTNFPQHLTPCGGLARTLRKFFRIARVDVNHRRAGFVCGLNRCCYFIRCFRNKFVGLFALDATVAGYADDERRHSGANPFHEFVAVGVVEPGWLLG